MHAVYNLSTLCKHIWLDFYIVGQSVFSPGHSQLSLFIRLLLFFLAWMCVWCELCEYVRVLPASPAFSITSIYYTGVIRLLCSWSKSTQSTLLLYLLPLMDFICVSLFSNSPCVALSSWMFFILMLSIMLSTSRKIRLSQTSAYSLFVGLSTTYTIVSDRHLS